ncbi:PIN domain-containing protein [Aeoliella sp. ICT_H6.2]|uniref:PIN domain-containing protein n=1 Tax=Aeoliella straminimaris TaxID=2954799 RepID=A0A9X2JI98_9BACT|nr:PIN domain-containing protein [Aeoliella straminimaris]MCO6046855.1 PIN domain-containing protein [Aeoliella straminimaris]
MNVLLDTNILTRWVNPQDRMHTTAVQALKAIRLAGHVCVLVPQNIFEFWAVATRPLQANGLGLSTEESVLEVDRLALPLFKILLDERGILAQWRKLVEDHQVQGKPTHDARLVAAMLRHRITHLLTFNTGDFTRYTEITIVHPDDVVSGMALGPTGP